MPSVFAVVHYHVLATGITAGVASIDHRTIDHQINDLEHLMCLQ